MNADRPVLAQYDPTAVQCLHRAQIIELHATVVLRFDDRLFKCLACRSTDVECPHRELRSRFTDGLGGDNSDRFAHLDELTAREVTAVTHSTNAAAAFASQHRANLQRFNADALQVCRNLLVDEL